MADETKQVRDLFPAELRKRMTKVYNRRLAEIHGKSLMKVPDSDPPQISEDDAVKMAIDIMEKKLGYLAGSTIPEIGAMIACVFGATSTGFHFQSIMAPVSNRDMTPERQLKMTNEDLKARDEWTELRKHEVAEFSKIAEAYIATFGEAHKNPMGITVMIGEQITVDRGHYKKLY
jgi:predicted lipase